MADSPAKKTTVAKEAAPAKKAAPARAVAKKAAPTKKATAVNKAAPAKTSPAAKETLNRNATSKSKTSARKRINRLKKASSAPASKFFEQVKQRAGKIIDDPDKLKKLANETSNTANRRPGPLSDVIDDLRTMIRLVMAYARGHYRAVSAETMILIVAGLLYVVMPIDLIPDAIPVAGLTDDAAVVVWVVKRVRGELDAFRDWETGHTD